MLYGPMAQLSMYYIIVFVLFCLVSLHGDYRVSPELIGSHNCVPMTFTAESPPAQGQ